MKTITMYECEFCRRLYRTENGVTAHETICFDNPKTHSCKTCAHLVTVYHSQGWDEEGYDETKCEVPPKDEWTARYSYPYCVSHCPDWKEKQNLIIAL